MIKKSIFQKPLILLTVLILMMTLFVGCGKDNKTNTSLQGTWRITEMTEEGKTKTFPYEEEIEGSTVQIQMYFQLKDNTIKMFTKMDNGTDSFVFLMGEETCTVSGNTIITFDGDIEEEVAFTISGQKITITDGTFTMKAVKVSDTEVAGAIPWPYN